MDVGPDGVNTDNADKKEKKSWYRFTQKVEFTSTALILTCIKAQVLFTQRANIPLRFWVHLCQISCK